MCICILVYPRPLCTLSTLRLLSFADVHLNLALYAAAALAIVVKLRERRVFTALGLSINLGSNMANDIVNTERELSNKVLEILERVKKKGKGQYFENIALECASKYDWNRPKVLEELKTAVKSNCIKEVPFNGKISYRKVDTQGKNVCIRDEIAAAHTDAHTDAQDKDKTPSVEPEPAPSTSCLTDMLYNEFQDFKRHVLDETASIKYPPKKETEDTAKSYEKALFKSQEMRMISVEKQMEQKQSIIDKLLHIIDTHQQNQVKTTSIESPQSCNTTKENKNADDKLKTKAKQPQEKKRIGNPSGETTESLPDKNEKSGGPIEKKKGKQQEEKEVSQENREPTNANDEEIKESSDDKKGRQNVKKRVFVIGGSITNGMNDRGLSTKHNVNVRNQPGATTEDMADHIKPILRKSPDLIILHCGTNDLANEVDTIGQIKQDWKASKDNVPNKRNCILQFDNKERS